MKRAVFIGRFQPIHNGHLTVMQDLSQNFDEVVILIGSSQYAGTKDNPFSFAERKTMIEQLLKKHLPQLKYYIIPLPDIHDDSKWPLYVHETILNTVDTYDSIITGNIWVKELLEQAGIVPQPVHKIIPIDATTIRSMIRKHDTHWKDYVDPLIHDMVEQPIITTAING